MTKSHEHILYSPAGKFLVEKSEFSSVNTGNYSLLCFYQLYLFIPW